MIKSIAIISLLVSVCGFSQGWQKVDENGTVSGNQKCKWWDTLEDLKYDKSDGEYVATIKAGGAINMCSGGSQNSVTGGPVLYENNLNEDLKMRLEFVENINDKCDTNRLYTTSWTNVVAGSKETVDVYGKGPLNKDIGEQYCFRLVVL